MKYQKENPKEDGTYFVRDTRSIKPEVVRLLGEYVFYVGSPIMLRLDYFNGCEWYGPVDPPTDEK